MINIVTTFYISNYKSGLDNDRTKELVETLQNNISSSFIKKIHLFVDDDKSLTYLNSITKSDKIVIIEVGKKPIYSDFFKYILAKLKDEICMITNADIYISECDTNIINKLLNEKLVYALTRYEYDMSHPLIKNFGGSHDCYIFNSSFINQNIINNHTHYSQNCPGIESHMIKNFCDQGFNVLNPCYQIKIVHLHKTQLRRHTEWIGLHKSGDLTHFQNSCWYIPPIGIGVVEIK